MSAPWEDVRRILEVGVRAVSPYNIQPWRFRRADGDLDIYVIRTKNFFLKLRGVSSMTLGFLVENMDQGARHLGYRMDVDILGFHLNLDKPIARVRFSAAPGPRPDINHVLTRRTNRHPFSGPLSPAERQALHTLFDGLSDGIGRVRCLEGEEQGILGHILADLEFCRMSNEKLLSEAVEFVRVGPAENLAQRDRLDEATLWLPPLERTGYLLWKRWPVFRPILTWVASHRKRENRRQFFREAAGIIVFTVGNEDYKTYIELGRRIQRCLNELCRIGLDAQAVLSGLYLLHLIFENPEIFSPREKDILVTCRRDIEMLLGEQDRRIAFLVRVGHAAAATPETLRKNVDALLLP